jgi:hypothetical protein
MCNNYKGLTGNLQALIPRNKVSISNRLLGITTYYAPTNNNQLSPNTALTSFVFRYLSCLTQ